MNDRLTAWITARLLPHAEALGEALAFVLIWLTALCPPLRRKLRRWAEKPFPFEREAPGR